MSGGLYNAGGGGGGAGGGVNLAASNTTYTSGTVVISGSTNITVLTNGQTILLSANDPAAAAGVSALQASNTTYTSGKVILTGVGGGVTVSSNTGQRIDISVAAPVAETQVAISGVSASDALYTSGTVRITGVGGGITVSSNTGQRIDLSVAAPVAQTAETAISGVSASDTLYTSGTVRITGVGGGITVSSNTGQRIDLSVAAPVAQTAQTGISGIANSQTTYTSGTVSLSELGAITVRSTTGNQYQFSVNSQTVQTQNLHNVTLSGNTAGALAHISSGTLTLAGGNNITLSQAGNAVTISGGAGGAETQTAISGIRASDTTYTSGSVTITGVGGGVTVNSNTGQRVDISVAAPVAQTGTQFSAGLSNIGNTAGDTGTVAGRVVLAGGNNITLSGSTNGVSETITISGAAGGGAGFTAGMSNLGNTAGTSGVVTGQVVLVGTHDVTLSQSVNGGSATISIIPGPQMSRFRYPQDVTPVTAGGLQGNSSLYFVPIFVPGYLTAHNVGQLYSISGATGSTAAASHWFGVYTKNGSTLSTATTHSQSSSWTSGSIASNDWGGLIGYRWRMMSGQTFNFTPGDYWIGMINRSTNAGSWSLLGLSQIANAWSGHVGSLSNTSRLMDVGLGCYTAQTSAFPATVAFSQIGSLVGNNLRIPAFLMHHSDVSSG
jgi:hypothetical protein